MPVSREAVTWGYRFFLGRDPESEQAIAAHCCAIDERQLAQELIRSAEFAASQRLHFGTPPIDPWETDPMQVESAATAAEIEACLAKIAEAWRHLGLIRPHFSVLTDTRFLPDNFSQTAELFWRSGDAEIHRAARVLASHGMRELGGRTCVEYGCGVGRVSAALAARFARVDAYDISATHLLHARQRAAQLKLRNLAFHECSPRLLPDLPACDVFYSCIVLQHNPPPIIAALIRKALAALRPAGIAIFQVPVYIKGYSFRLAQWLGNAHPLDMQMHCLPQERIFELIEEQACVPLEMWQDPAIGAPDKMVSNTCVVRKK